MLFISDDYGEHRIGKLLLQHEIENYVVNQLVINEQNPITKGFYEHMGFMVYKGLYSTQKNKNIYKL